jgi:hypothetical protein
VKHDTGRSGLPYGLDQALRLPQHPDEHRSDRPPRSAVRRPCGSAGSSRIHPSARCARSEDLTPRAGVRVRLRDRSRRAQDPPEGQARHGWALRLGRVPQVRRRLAGSTLRREHRVTTRRRSGLPNSFAGSRLIRELSTCRGTFRPGPLGKRWLPGRNRDTSIARCGHR